MRRLLARAMLSASIAVAVAAVGGRAVLADTNPTTDAIQKYVAGEDNNFSDLQGKAATSDDTFAYYESSLQIPGAAACAIYTAKSSGDHFGTCDFVSDSADGVKLLFETWLGNIRAAEPDWAVLKVTNPKHIDQVIIADPKRVHGIYLYSAQDGVGKYRATITFGTMEAIER